MQSSKRSYPSIPDGASAVGGDSLPLVAGCGDGNRSMNEDMSTTRSAIDGEVGHGLHGHLPRIQVGEARHAREPLSAVHPDPAGAARGVEARMPDGEGLVEVDLDPSQPVQDGALRLDLRLEGVEPRRAVLACEPEDAEAAPADGGGVPLRSLLGGGVGRRHHAAK